MAYQPLNYDPANYIPADYMPGAEDTSLFGGGLSSREVDIRLYAADGTRKYLPSFWIDTADFEIAERGGYGNGRLSVLAGWEELELTGTEYVDIRLFGQFAYRGFVLQPEKSVEVPERWTFGLYGLMERLNGYLVRRCQCFTGAVDVSAVFLDIVTTYVQRANRLPNLVVEASGVEALGITVTDFCAEGSTVSQAFNDLCDAAPDQLLWGCDVDSSGNDRLYLRPKPTATTQKVFVGKDVRAFVYPRDYTQIVNVVYVTGAEADPKNLVTNGSFENCVKPGELTGNLLLNPSFEQNGGGSDFDDWDVGYNPTVDAVGHTGSASVYMDNNPAGPEEIAQHVPIGELNGLSMSAWMFVNAGGNNSIRMEMRLLDSSLNVLGGLHGFAFAPPDDDTWHKYTLHWENVRSGDFPGAAYAEARITLLACADDTAGVHVDDVALWVPAVGAEGWTVGASSSASFLDLEWRYSGSSPLPADGAVAVRVQADIGGGGYVEIKQSDESRPSVNGGRLYYMDFRVQPSGGSGVVQIGVREYDGGTLVDTQIGTEETLVNGLWQQVSFAFTTDAATNAVAPFIRFKTDERIYYLDGAGLWEGSLPSRYYPGDRFTAVKTTDDYDAVEIGSDAANSIDAYGEREAEEDAEIVRDEQSLDTWAKAYFRKWAIPQVEGRVEIFGATELLDQSGKVEIENLPDAPGGLFPSRIRVNIREVIEISADLNAEVPTLAGVLRKMQKETLRRR